MDMNILLTVLNVNCKISKGNKNCFPAGITSQVEYDQQLGGLVLLNFIAADTLSVSMLKQILKLPFP